MDKLSVVVPCYNEQEVMPIFYDAITKVLNGMSEVEPEVIFVDDGSKDDTLKTAKELAEKDKRIKYVSLSRNFGKEAAIYAGLKETAGDFVVLMDVDLQDPPELLPEMYKAIKEEGFDCVGTRRVTRKGEPVIRSFFARMFYRVINKVAQIEIVDGARDFRMMTRTMVTAIIETAEYNRFSKGIFSWVGFKTKWLPYENIERAAGKTKWSFWKLFKYSLEGIVAFSTAPLAFASLMGLLFCFLAFLIVIFIVVRTLMFGDNVAGWPSLVCIIFFIGGVQLFCMGILGQYLAKTYLETKKRPIYIVREKN